MTLEEFKKIIGKEAVQKLSEEELLKQFKLSETFANFAYKRWVESKLLKNKTKK